MKEGWEVKTLGEIAELKGGKRVPKGYKLELQNTGYPYIRVADFNDVGSVDLDDIHYISKDVYEGIKRYIITDSDVYISIAGTIGKSGIIPKELNGANLTENACRLVLRPGLYNRFVYYSTINPFFKDQLIALTMQAAQPKLALTRLATAVVSVPPLPEQERIVSILDTEFAKIDALKANAEKSLQHAKDLFQAALYDGIRGKLYCNDTCQENNLADLLRREKEKLEKEKLIPRKPQVPPVQIDDAVPFEIPSHWTWCKLAEVSLIQEGAGIRKFQYKDEGTQLLTVTNIIDGVTSYIDKSKHQIYISSEEYKQKYQQLTLHKGDIVCACSGGSWGKSARYEDDELMMLNTSTLRLRFWNDLGDNRFLYYLTKSKFFKYQLEVQLSGMQPNFGYAHYSKILIPIPSLEEQIKIANILEATYKKCSKLQSNYERTIALCDDMKQALLRKAFNGEL